MIDKKLIVEVRLNEWAMRDRNPHVPWSPAEIANDAEACWKAGASIVHFHVRSPDGSPAHDVALYGEAIRAIRERSDVLIHPTLAGVVTPEPRARLAPLLALCEDPGTRPDFAPLDMGSTNLDAYDAVQRRFTTEQKVYVNSVGTLRFLAEHVRALGLKELLCVWTVPCMRTIGAFANAGWLGAPHFACLVLTEGGILGGHPGTVRGLDSLIEFLPTDTAVEWSVCCREGNLFAVAAAAIERGGHVSIGLGDYAYPELGPVSNAELVQRVAAQAALQGRALASVTDTRAMLGMTRTL